LFGFISVNYRFSAIRSPATHRAYALWFVALPFNTSAVVTPLRAFLPRLRTTAICLLTALWSAFRALITVRGCWCRGYTLPLRTVNAHALVRYRALYRGLLVVTPLFTLRAVRWFTVGCRLPCLPLPPTFCHHLQFCDLTCRVCAANATARYTTTRRCRTCAYLTLLYAADLVYGSVQRPVVHHILRLTALGARSATVLPHTRLRSHVHAPACRRPRLATPDSGLYYLTFRTCCDAGYSFTPRLRTSLYRIVALAHDVTARLARAARNGQRVRRSTVLTCCLSRTTHLPHARTGASSPFTFPQHLTILDATARSIPVCCWLSCGYWFYS